MIQIYTTAEIAILREGGKILANILNTLKKAAVEGVSTTDLNKMAFDLCVAADAKPAFLNYTPQGSSKPFPASICISINEEVVHGIPNQNPKILKRGDVAVLDMGLLYKDMFTDSAVTLVIGGDEANTTGAAMIQVASEALQAAIDTLKPGVRTGTVGHAIEAVVNRHAKEGRRFSIPMELGGHGIGHSVHEDPFMPNFGKKGEGVIMREGMVVAIEPILTEKKPHIKLLRDGYTYVTADKGLSVHVEHTVVVTKDGAEILTQ
ncbi:MAG: hypothetical protein RJB39_517 [Candidatus Parcubacteria bacterium]|jgi:methionyl aminopeptidase